MSTAAGRWTRVRIAACGVGFAVLFFGIGSRAYDLQIRDRDKLRAMAEEQYLREIELPPRRGRILDRNGAELASSADMDSVYCNPRMLPDPAAAATGLGRALGMDRRELEKKLSQRRFFAWVKRHISPEEAAAVKALDLPGIGFAREPRRVYPSSTLAATVMGHAGTDGRGLDGVELAFDKVLAGTTSSLQGVRDALGRELFIDGMAEPGAGAGRDVVLTIDRYLTFVTERALGKAVDATHAKAGISIMLDPRTGEVLAMAAAPTYNPNDPGNAAAAGARNRAITDAFEPGSTMKTFTIAAALDAGAVKPDDRIDCMMGRLSVGKYQIHDTHPHGVLTVSEIFKFSSNIGATKVARRLGKENLHEALGRFGFGRPTGVGLPGERSGVLRPVARWGDIGFANVSFGQGMTATPLQIAAGVAAIAGGGVYRPPHIVTRVVSGDGRSETVPAPPERRVISEAAARTMAGIMLGVTEAGGTARQAAVEGYTVAGKTGTAQKVSGGHYDASKWVASFVGFAPADNPRVVILVILDEPQGVHLGGAVSAPVFKEIAEQALRYLHVPPTSGATAAAKAPVRAGKVPAAAAPDDEPEEAPGSDVATTSEGEDGEADGEGGGEDPAASEGDAPGGGEVVAMPNFSGMTIAEALRAARKVGVEVRPEGSGVAMRQKPDPGPAARGALCRVVFEPRQ